MKQVAVFKTNKDKYVALHAMETAPQTPSIPVGEPHLFQVRDQRACTFDQQDGRDNGDHITSRRQLFITIKILFHLLEGNLEEEKLKEAKKMVKDCIRRHRRQERGYESLVDTIKPRFRSIVGTARWNKLEDYLRNTL